MTDLKNSTPEAIQARYYERSASSYDEKSASEAARVSDALNFIDHLSNMYKLETFIDVGAGTGRGTRFLLDRGKNVRGIEPVLELIKQAEMHGVPKGTIQHGDGYSLPFASGSVDACIEVAVLHHVAKPELVVAEMTRVARHAVFLVDWNRFGHGTYISRLAKLFLYKTKLWSAFRYFRTFGKMYTISEGDGLAYSYSVYDSYDQLAAWADNIVLYPIELAAPKMNSWFHPLLTAPGLVLCAIKK